MKTFFNLIQDVRKKGRCHRCGACVTFCSAINYGALEIGKDGKPDFKNIEECIECGICYMICPETGQLDEEVKKKFEWSAPAGRIIETNVARARDLIVREEGTDGGVVTALLLHLFDTGKINGAVVAKSTPQGRQPWLAHSREEILDAAGTHLDFSHGMAHLASSYSTFAPSIKALHEIRKEGIDRIAFVGTPCQVNAIRRMQVLGVVPADSIEICLGLFCSGHFNFSRESFAPLEKRHDFSFDEIDSINIKENLILTLTTGEQREIPLTELEDLKRGACRYCNDFSAEYADISFGGLGAEHGWTTMVTRSSLGRTVLTEALKNVVEPFPYERDKTFATQAEDKIIRATRSKQEIARVNLKTLAPGPVIVG